MLTNEEAMELMAEDIAFDIPIKHESKPYLMIPLPDGATNGDVIKAMFPNKKLSVFADGHGHKTISVKFTVTEWNASYKVESEGKCTV